MNVDAIKRELSRTANQQRAAQAALDSRISELPELRAWERVQTKRRQLESELKAALETRYGRKEAQR